MNFSEEEKNEILDKHLEKVKKDGKKKYVVTIYQENIETIDSMSIQERNDVINDIISLHKDNVNEKKHKQNIIKFLIYGIVCFLILLFIAPFTLWLINYSFTTTQNNYNEMQNNFEVLYQKKK